MCFHKNSKYLFWLIEKRKLSIGFKIFIDLKADRINKSRLKFWQPIVQKISFFLVIKSHCIKLSIEKNRQVLIGDSSSLTVILITTSPSRVIEIRESLISNGDMTCFIGRKLPSCPACKLRNQFGKATTRRKSDRELICSFSLVVGINHRLTAIASIAKFYPLRRKNKIIIWNIGLLKLKEGKEGCIKNHFFFSAIFSRSSVNALLLFFIKKHQMFKSP